MSADDLQVIAAFVAAGIALAALLKGVYEYTKQVKQRRADLFLSIEKTFKESETFKEIFELLEYDSNALRELAWDKKVELLGFYEQIALLVNSGLMKPHVAHYMFSYYAIRCWESDNFWNDVNRDSHYWALYKSFVEEMSEIEESFKFDKSRYTL